MNSFIEIMDFCGFDLPEASAMAAQFAAERKEGTLNAVETLESKPVRKKCRGLCCPCDECGTRR